MMLNIRNLTTADIAKIDSVLMAAFGRTSSFQSQLQLCLGLQPDGWLIAESAGTPVGIVGAVDYGAFAYIGLMAVHPAFQGRGIGLMLMQRLLAWLEERGCASAMLDATEAGASLYAKLGFVEEEKSLVFQRTAIAPLHLNPSSCVNALQPSDLAALAAFDTPIFGANRQPVFAAFLRKFPGRAFVVRDQAGQIVGYLFAQSQNLGPWAANTLEAASSLIAAVWQLPFDSLPGVLVPGGNLTARELLLRYGFKEKRRLSHMRRGGSGALGCRTLLYGMANFALG